MNHNFTDFPGSALNLSLGPRSYPILIGAGTLNRMGKYLSHIIGPKKAAIISDSNVAPLYSSDVLTTLESAHYTTHLITVPAGESSKCSATMEMIYDQLFDYSVERSDIIVALGGGVVGDIAGFAAATFKRGLNYVQVPTTLLAMVDSSVGGKTGINHPRGKNMIGAFHQPSLVFTDTDTLKTLPERELGCGLSETVKHAVIRDRNFFDFLENQSQSITALQSETIAKFVQTNCRIKAEIVSADERESHLRGILNFGHTIGHAIETVMTDQDFHHGEAVALGMTAATRLAVHRSLLDPIPAQRIINLLSAFKLPTHITADLPLDRLYQALCHDKKVKDGKITFVLPTAIGCCTFVNDLTKSEIKNAIRSLAEKNSSI